MTALESILGRAEEGDDVAHDARRRARSRRPSTRCGSGHKGARRRARRRDGRACCAMASAPELRPERARRPATLRAAQPRRGERPARQPRDAERLPARLDDEGRDRRRRARQRAATARTRASTASNGKEISGVPLNNFGSESFGDDRPHVRAHQLRQHGLGRGRRGARWPHDAALHGALRVLRRAADGLPRRADVRLRRAQARATWCR